MEAAISAVPAGKHEGHLNYAGSAFPRSGSVSGGVPSLADQFRTWINAKLIKMICDPQVNALERRCEKLISLEFNTM
jgi:hypothetical protein